MAAEIISGKEVAKAIRAELKEEVAELTAQHGVVPGLATVLVGDDQVGKNYGNVEIVPTTFIIDRGGNIAHKILGARSKADFENLIRPLL